MPAGRRGSIRIKVLPKEDAEANVRVDYYIPAYPIGPRINVRKPSLRQYIRPIIKTEPIQYCIEPVIPDEYICPAPIDPNPIKAYIEVADDENR